MTQTRHILFLLVSLLLCLSSQAGIHQYAEQSILSEGNWVKVRVSGTGVCRMHFDQIRQAGLNPQQLRVFGYGGAQLEQDFTKTKIDDLPQVPVYVGDDYVLFWVQGPYSWQYSGSRFMHTRNTYSNYGYYFLTDNSGEMMAMPYAEEISGTPTDVYTYTNYQVHESDSINLVDKDGKSGGGKHFYGETFSVNEKMVFSFNTPNAIEGEMGSAYIDVAAYSAYSSSFTISINNSTKQAISIAPYGNDHFVRANVGALNMRGSMAANKQEVALTMQCSSVNATGWLNYIELITPCSLQMNGSWLPIRSTVNYKNSTPIRFHLQGVNEHTHIWDVTNKATIKRVPTTMQGEEMVWVGSQQQGISEFVAVNTQANSEWITAEVMGNKVNCIYDVGVAGIHRLFNKLELIREANVLIVVAGMEGALASVIGGLVDKPVVAVPTSVGYGANFGGLSALLGMLNSCSAGVAVVNIDNGFGAGYLANMINHMETKS